MRFRVLGSLDVFAGSGWRGIPAAKPRSLLAALLMAGGKPVSADELSRELWGDEAPRSAPNLIQQYVLRLRRELGDEQGRTLVTRSPGYRLRLEDPESLDAVRFARLTAEGRRMLVEGTPERASALLSEGLSLWRGPAFADVHPTHAVEAEAERLEEQRLAALEARITADLGCGRHRELTAELGKLVTEYPLREELWKLYMLALYRSGRQADALRVHRDLQGLLRKELGVAPSYAVQRLHQQILTGDPALEAAAPPSSAAASSSAAATAPPPAPAPDADSAGGPGFPRQLPGCVPHFVGRQEELRQLSAQLPAPCAPSGPSAASDDSRAFGCGAPVVLVISGTAGVGKSALALHWAHQVAARFPDGQLYLNLRGFGPTGPPVTPEEALRGFLTALAVPAERIPDDPEAQSALLRTLLSERRVLMVLDNAHDAAQVRPLLPGSPGCAVVITSRHRLAALAVTSQARLVPLDVLSEDEAHDLLAARIGAARVLAEPQEARALIDQCARLPLALAVIAARALTRPGFPLGVLAAELRHLHQRLDALDAGEQDGNVRAVFSWSCRQLDPTDARVFRLLSQHPGGDIPLAVASAVTGLPPTRARASLTRLTETHLIAETAPGRYSFHDLLRAYAAEQALAVDGEQECAAALRRGLDHWLRTAYAAARCLSPVREIPGLDPVTAFEPSDSYERAMAWFDTEHPGLMAAAAQAMTAGLPGHTWRLGLALADYFHRSGRWHDWTATQKNSLAAAALAGESVGQALVHCELGRAYVRLGRYAEARTELDRALTLQEQAEDLHGQAATLQTLSWVYEREGDIRTGVDHARRALELRRATGDLAGQASALNNIGLCICQLGEYDEALSCCREALALHEVTGNRHLVADTWDSLGYIHRQRGAYREATDCYRQALDQHRQLGNRYDEANVLRELAVVQEAAGDPRAARDSLRLALAVLEELDHPEAEALRGRLHSAAPELT
ncbi:BTAD domain-containing putative transcriptional regulator [Streptomyces sp. NPDC052644]